MKTTYEKIQEEIATYKGSSAWKRGVLAYAEELAENLEGMTDAEIADPAKVEEALLNGAENWDEYSWGGCSLIYNGDICQRLATPSEKKKTKGGENRPNAREKWLDVQARALYQAADLIKRACRKVAPAVPVSGGAVSTYSMECNRAVVDAVKEAAEEIGAEIEVSGIFSDLYHVSIETTEEGAAFINARIG